MSQMQQVPEMPKMLSALLFPVCGLFLLGGSLVLRSGTDAPQSAMDVGTPQIAPASANVVRLTILRRQYRFYIVCKRKEQYARDQGLVRQAVALYNQAVADTDPSAFDNTTLPRHL